jgi:hypothetical protein
VHEKVLEKATIVGGDEKIHSLLHLSLPKTEILALVGLRVGEERGERKKAESYQK